MSEASKVLLTGGTSPVGSAMLPLLTEQGRSVAVLSRRAGQAPPGVSRLVGDLRTGAGLPQALRGVQVLVHLASDPRRAREVDVEGTGRLLQAAAVAGVQQVLYLSIVGCERVPYGYYRAKVAAEELVLGGPVVGTVLRATQFHDFVPRVAGVLSRGPFLCCPEGLRAQLVDVRDVADRLAGLVAAGPQRSAGRAPDVAGPQVIDLAEAVHAWGGAVGRRRLRTVRLPAVGAALRALAAGANLPAADAELGGRTYGDWLDAQLPVGR